MDVEEEGLEEEIEVSDVNDLSDIEYEGHDLEYWEDFLTVKIPALPCSSQLMTSTLIELNNKYQIAYNCYNKLLVLTSKADKMFKNESDKVVRGMLLDYQKKGAKQIPPLDKLAIIALGQNNTIKAMYEIKEIYSTIKDFFQNNKTKLERVLASAKDISYSINQSDKNNQMDRGHGM